MRCAEPWGAKDEAADFCSTCSHQVFDEILLRIWLQKLSSCSRGEAQRNCMAPVLFHLPNFSALNPFRTHSTPFQSVPLYNNDSFPKPLVIVGRANTRKESAKVRNRRLQKKFNGSSVRPRLSVFCSAKQLYAMLVDDQNKKCLFYRSTLQKSIRENPSCSTVEAAQRVGEELVKACRDLKINEISSYDRNGFARGERMAAFEIAIAHHGFLPR